MFIAKTVEETITRVQAEAVGLSHGSYAEVVNRRGITDMDVGRAVSDAMERLEEKFGKDLDGYDISLITFVIRFDQST